MLTHIGVAVHTNLIPADWKPVVQAITDRPHDDRVRFVEVWMAALGDTFATIPTITISEGSRGAYHWTATANSTFAGQDVEYAIADAVAAGVHAIREALALVERAA